MRRKGDNSEAYKEGERNKFVFEKGLGERS